MKIRQILNNNVAIVKRGGNEIIVVSKGVSFKYKVGAKLKDEDIEKSYILDSYDKLEHFSYLLAHSNPEDILLIDQIISHGESRLEIKANDYLSLTLLDHLEFLLERVEKEQFIKSPLIWDIKRFYPEYFEIGCHALKLIEQAKDVALPEDEAVSISLHFLNLQTNKKSKEDVLLEMQALADIVAIIEKHFLIQLDEGSTNYMRFTTHIQYFVQRLVQKKIASDDENLDRLYQQVSQLYPEAFNSVQKIRIYVRSQFDVEMTISEETYLMLHINRVTNRLEEKNEL